MVNIKIYQAYFDKNQLPCLDPEFIPLDNTVNLQPELREYPIFLKCRERAIQDNADIWGYLSWKWKEKISGLTPQGVIDRIANNPGYDVYFFNYTKTTFSYNVWEQGEKCHPELLKIMGEIFPLMGIDPEILYQPMTNQVSFFALYCAGNSRWWNGLIDFTTKFVNAIPLLSNDCKLLYNSSARYRDLNLNYFPFIHERLLSTYLLLNQNSFKILPFHNEVDTPVESMLENIKITAIEKNDQTIMDAWFRLRNSYHPMYATNNWSNRLKTSIFKNI